VTLNIVKDLTRKVAPDRLVLTLRVTPRGGAARIDGLGHDADGNSFLKLRVSEAPEKGKANTAVIKLLAAEWKLPRSCLNIVAGAGDRNKRLEITGNPQALYENIALWCQKAGLALDPTEKADG